jgi:hypothetical protein
MSSIFHGCVCVFMCVCVCVCLNNAQNNETISSPFTCVCVCLYVCMYVCVCVLIENVKTMQLVSSTMSFFFFIHHLSRLVLVFSLPDGSLQWSTVLFFFCPLSFPLFVFPVSLSPPLSPLFLFSLPVGSLQLYSYFCA